MCWESIRDDRLVDVNIVEIYTLSLVSTSLFAVENGDIWETPYGWCLCAGLFQGIDHTQEKCLFESFGPGIDTVLRKEYLGKLDSIPGVPINSPSVVFSVWRVWRIQVNFNPVVSASTICARARDLLEVLVSFEMFRHASVVHNEYWSDVDRVFEYHHFWLQFPTTKKPPVVCESDIWSHLVGFSTTGFYPTATEKQKRSFSMTPGTQAMSQDSKITLEVQPPRNGGGTRMVQVCSQPYCGKSENF